MSEDDDALFRATYLWWKEHRPIGWSENQHLENPDVNCPSEKETNLAIQFAEILKRRRKNKGGKTT